MKSFSRILLGRKCLEVFFLLFSFSVSGRIFGQDMLFYVQYEDTFNAVQSGGSATGTADAEKILFIDALDHRGISYRENGYAVQYETTKNINIEKGTIVFWTSHSWIYSSEASNIFFRVGINDFRIYKDPSINGLIVELKDSGKVQRSMVADMSEIETKYWYKIAVTWNSSKKEIRLYVNGAFINSLTVKDWPNTWDSFMHVGPSADMKYDILKIFSEDLYPAQIKALYHKDAVCFYLSYNGTPLPDKNYGDPTTNQAGPSFEFTEGVKRECLLMGSSDHYLQYKRAQNFPKRRGTVNLWVKHSWIYNDINFHIFFNTTDMMLYKHQNDDRLSFLVVDGNQQLQYLNVALSDNIDDTDADQWYMITVMWNETKTKIFINGKFMKERIISSTTDNQGDNFTIGRQWGTLAVDDTSLDEFTVFNANLTEQEISDLYRKNGKSSLLFYASFDDESPDADFSVGDAKGTPTAGLAFIDGIKGKAASLGSQYIYYNTAGNIRPEKGSLEMWVKPLDWEPGVPGKWLRFFGFGYDFVFSKYHQGAGNNLQLRLHHDDQYTTVSADVSDWKMNLWYHLVLTWQYDSVNIYVNGEHKITGSNRNFPREFNAYPFTAFYIGKGHPLLLGNFVMDEFKIYNKALSKAEIFENYLSTSKLFTIKYEGVLEDDSNYLADVTVYPSDYVFQTPTAIIGQGLLCGEAGYYLKYSYPESSFVLKKGSIQFWTKHDWIYEASPARFRVFFRSETGNVYIYKHANTFRNHLLLYYHEDGVTTYTKADMSEYVPGEWYMVTITWDDEYFRTYINDELKGENAIPDGFNGIDLGDSFYLSKQMGVQDGFNTVIDEFSIYSSSLTTETIKQIYEIASVNLVPLADDGILKAEFDVSGMTRGDVPFSSYSVDFKIKDDIRDVIFESGVEYFKRKGRSVIDVPMNLLTMGATYTATVSVKNLIDEQTYLYTESFAVPDFSDWLGNNIGKGGVPAPWTAVTETSISVSVWGRRYEFDNSILPTQIASQSENLLVSRVALYAKINNITYELGNGTPDIEHINDEKAAVKGSSTIGSTINIDADMEIEFDGMVKVELTLTKNVSCAQLEKLYIDIPLHKDHMKYYNFTHQMWKHGSSENPTKFFPDHSGDLDESWDLPFMNWLWLGSEKVGFHWFSESPKGFINQDCEKMIQVLHHGNEVVLRINFIDMHADKSFALHRPLQLTFGIMATPVKPRLEKWKEIIFGAAWGDLNPDFHTMLRKYSDSFTFLDLERDGDPLDTESYQDLIDEMATEKIGVLRVNNIFTFSDRKPDEYDWYKDQWRVYYNYTNPVMDAKYPSFVDWKLDHFDKHFDDFPDLMGVYLDSFPMLNINQYNSDYAIYNPGCNSWYHSKGIFGARELFKRLYRRIKDDNPNRYIFVIGGFGFPNYVCFSFVDGILDGEQYLYMDRAYDPEHPEKYVPDYYEDWPLEQARAQLLTEGKGVGCLFFPELNHGWANDPEYSEAAILATEKFMMILALHDNLPTHQGRAHKPTQLEFRKAFEKMGTWNYEFLSYFKDNNNQSHITGGTSNNYISICKVQNSKAMIVIANYGETAQKDEVFTLNLSKFGFTSGHFSAENARTGKAITISNSNELVVDIPARNGLLIFLKSSIVDLDGDGDLDTSDLAIFAANFNKTNCCQAGVPPCQGDFNGDCDVDGSDLAVLAAEFAWKLLDF